MNPKADSRGFRIFSFDESNWHKECLAEREMPPEFGASSMTLHDSYSEAIDHARKNMPESLFTICF
jgi:hypothetical protein